MNKLIKQLWKDAGGSYTAGNQHDWPSASIDDPEKFAELLVRECAKLVKSADLSHDGHTWRAADVVVLEHFGVK
jgi:hypothetical protein